MKRKKKHHQAQKQAQAENTNRFLGRLRQLGSRIIGDKDMDLFLSRRKNQVLFTRVPLPKAVPITGSFSADSLRQADDLIRLALDNEKVNYLIDGPEMSLRDYFSEGITLLLSILSMEENAFSGSEDIKKKLVSVVDVNRVYDQATRLINLTASAIACVLTDPGRVICWGRQKITIIRDLVHPVLNRIELFRVAPEHTSVCINGTARPVVRVGYPKDGHSLNYIGIEPEKLHIRMAVSSAPIDVYIQHHALWRFAERLDCVDAGIRQMMLVTSLMNPVAIRDRSGTILLEFRHNDTLLGYLPCDIVDRKLIIRTFLFLTNNGTPEAEKLKQATGLNRQDIEHLSINKLSAFMRSDILVNGKTRELFSESGCRSLIELHDSMYASHTENSGHSAADRLIKYLQMPGSDEGVQLQA